MTDKDFKVTRRKFLLGLAGLSLATWRVPAAEAFVPFEPFSFAYVSDVHLSNDLPDSFILTRESQLFLQQTVKQLNAEKVDFVLFGGDQVETPGKSDCNWTLFGEIIQGLNAPWAFVLGDRDVSGDRGVDKLRTYGADWKDQGIKTSSSYWSANFEPIPNVHFIGLDTSLPNTTMGGMSGKQLEWLKQDLTENKKYFTIVLAHHPLLPPPPYDGGPPWDDYVIPDGGSVREVLAPHTQVKMVLSGHVHVTRVQYENNIWHIANPSLAVYPCSYRIFRVSSQTVEMETQIVEFPALVKKGRKALLDSVMASRYSRNDPGSFIAVVEGTKEDQEAIIPMGPGKRNLEPYNPRKAAKQRAKDSGERPAKVQQEQPPPAEEKRGRFGRRKNEPTTEPVNTQPGSKVDLQPDTETQTEMPDDSTPPSTAPKTTRPDISPEPTKKGGTAGSGKTGSSGSTTKGTTGKSGTPSGSEDTTGGESTGKSNETGRPDGSKDNSAPPDSPPAPSRPRPRPRKPSPPENEETEKLPPAKPEDLDKILNGDSPPAEPPAGDKSTFTKGTDKK